MNWKKSIWFSYEISKYWEGKVLFKVKNKESTTVFPVTKILLSFMFSIKKLLATQLIDTKYKLPIYI